MKIAMGADHKGFQLKESLKSYLRDKGIAVEDFGTDSETSTDYPDYGRPAAEAVANGKADLAVVICWTGNGMNMVANKTPGARSALALIPEMARLARAHNNANVLALAARYTTEDLARDIVDRFLETKFDGGRHERRVGKMESPVPAK